MKENEIKIGKTYRVNKETVEANKYILLSDLYSFLINKRKVKILLFSKTPNSPSHYAIHFEGFQSTHTLREYPHPYTYLPVSLLDIFSRYDNSYQEEFEI